MRRGLDLQLLSRVPFAVFFVARAEELDPCDAALQGGEVEEDVFAPLAALFELGLA